MAAESSVKEPLDLIRLSIDEEVYVKCRGGRELTGRLQAYDEHLNLLLSEVQETVTTTEVDEETYEEIVKENKRSMDMLFIRGDVIILVVPPVRTA